MLKKTPVGRRAESGSGKLFDVPILVWIRFRLNKIREWLCRLICGDRLFNSDMSLEIDRLQVENEHLRNLLKGKS